MNPSETTRKKTEISNRRQIVAERYLRGAYMSQIADELEVDTATISRDLAELRKEWLERSINHIDQKKAIELAKLDQLELTYWDAWVRSQRDAESETMEQIGVAKGADGQIIGDRVKKTKKREGQAGDPRFLDGVLKCIAKRCELLGLDAPKKTDITSKGGPVTFTVVFEDKQDGSGE